jgi:nucleoside-diphosphate-sugar epimerase
VSIDRVLVTGAGGFIGSHLVDDQLARGREVVALDVDITRLAHQKENDKCTLVTGDIRDAALLESIVPGSDVVFHLASAHLEVNKPASYFEEINIAAVTSLVGVCRTHRVGRFVHCSSVGVFGSLDKLPANEDTECNPTILYEKTKLAGEQALKASAKDLDYVILRPAWVYGPRCNRTLKLFQAIKRRKFIKVGFKKTYRHPIYISDMLAAFESAAAVPGASGKTLIIGDDGAVLLDQLIRDVESAVGSNISPVTVPLVVMYPACLLVEKIWGVRGKEPPFSRRSLKFFTESSAFDISRARDILNFDPKVGLAEGLAETARQFSNEGLL